MHPLKVLRYKKGRDELRQFIVEGEKAVSEIPEDWNIFYYGCSEYYASRHDMNRFKNRAPVGKFRDSLFDSFTDTKTPQGILAVCEQKHFTAKALIKRGVFLLIGENLSDPGNIGALIRTAAAAGVNGVLLSQGSAEIYNPKVVRAAAGALLKIPIATDVNLTDAVTLCKNKSVSVYATAPHEGEIPYDVDLRKGCAFLVGNEARGLSDEALSMADALLQLPMPGGAESLNAAVAGSILLYEAVRQKLKTVKSKIIKEEAE